MTLFGAEGDQAIAEWRNAAANLWPVLSGHMLPGVIETIYDRATGGLPDFFAPWSPGVAVAAEALLEKAGFDASWKRSGWKLGGEDSFHKLMPSRNIVLVRGCGELWTVERGLDDVLTYQPAGLVFFARERDQAMCLAEYFFPDRAVLSNPEHQQLRGAPYGLRWLVSDQFGINQLFRH